MSQPGFSHSQPYSLLPGASGTPQSFPPVLPPLSVLPPMPLVSVLPSVGPTLVPLGSIVALLLLSDGSPLVDELVSSEDELVSGSAVVELSELVVPLDVEPLSLLPVTGSPLVDELSDDVEV